MSSDNNHASITNSKKSCSERFGDTIEAGISSFFYKLGSFVGHRPKTTLFLCFALTALCGIGFLNWQIEARPEELFVPQDTEAETEEDAYLSYFPRTARFNQMILQTVVRPTTDQQGVLNKEILVEAMKVHLRIETGIAEIEDQDGVEGGKFTFLDLCAPAGGTCASQFPSPGVASICGCLVTSVLKQWNYNLTALEEDNDYLTTLQQYGTREDLEGVLGGAVFDEETGLIVSAEALVVNYFLQDRSVEKDAERTDPINFGWEEQVFLDVVEEEIPANHKALVVDYIAGRSFDDEFGGAIQGDLLLVQISYIVVFLFLGASLGNIKCGTGSRWTMSLAALVMIGISTAACFGIASACGLFYGPVHSLLPFILLGIGVDDAFVIVNAFDRERKTTRAEEDDASLGDRCARSLARGGSSITVTSATDLVAFAISSTASLPALGSFCAYAAIGIFFLWLFAATFFTACLVLDERRQRDNRRECFCCVTRGKELQDDDNSYQEEGRISNYFRKYHAPIILSGKGKIATAVIFTALLGFGFYGALNLSVEDSGRAFIPKDSYVTDWFDASDDYFPSQGTQVAFIFEGSSEIYASRWYLAMLENRLSNKSEMPPYLAEPVSEDAYQNVMEGLASYLAFFGTSAVGNATLGDDGWPTTEADFVETLRQYTSFTGPGAVYAQDVSYGDDGSLLGYRVKSKYVKLVKKEKDGEVIDDAAKLIDAMDSTRAMVESWEDLPPAFPYSDYFYTIEGFKVVQRELYQNVIVSILAVGVVVFFTVASPLTSILITLNVGFCIIEILGFMFALGIVIDSVSVINISLAVGLSVDYSAHVGHCFMVKGGTDKNKRVTEALADIGAAVLNGALSTFLAVVVLLFSSSYVFNVLSKQFALTVGLGLLHGLVALPVMLATIGPKPFSSAEELASEGETDKSMAPTGHASVDGSINESNHDQNEKRKSRILAVDAAKESKGGDLPIDDESVYSEA